jgi:hypothetical protein
MLSDINEFWIHSILRQGRWTWTVPLLVLLYAEVVQIPTS